MTFPNVFKYTKDHEWAKFEGNTVTIGITDHAQKALGDVVFVELPVEGRVLKSGETFGVVESIKAVSDLYAPVSGKVIRVNSSLSDDPSQVNQDPHEKGWMIQVELTDSDSQKNLLDAAAYENYVASLK